MTRTFIICTVAAFSLCLHIVQLLYKILPSRPNTITYTETRAIINELRSSPHSSTLYARSTQIPLRPRKPQPCVSAAPAPANPSSLKSAVLDLVTPPPSTYPNHKGLHTRNTRTSHVLRGLAHPAMDGEVRAGLLLSGGRGLCIEDDF